MKMNRDFVALHLITNGENPSVDSIIAIEAKLVRQGVVEKEFFRYVKPIQPLTATITLLTDIHNLDVVDAPSITEVIEELSHFVENYPLVLESEYEINFLQSALLGIDPDIDNRLINLQRVMNVKYPDCKVDQLVQIGHELGLTNDSTPDLERIVLLYGHIFVEEARGQ